MSVLRQHTVLLDQSGAAPFVGPAFTLTPSDADTVADANQTFVALVSLSRPFGSPTTASVPSAAQPAAAIESASGARLSASALPGRIPLPTTPVRPGGVIVGPSTPATPTPTTPANPTPTAPTTPATPSTPATPTSPTPTAPAVSALSVVVEGSFDQVHWAILGFATLLAGADALDELIELGPVPTHVRTRVVDASGAAAFDWTAYVAFASSAPYRARAAA